MLDSILSSAPASILEKALSSSALRQKVISNNIANVNTPGFKKSTVPFEDRLQAAISQTQLPLVQTHQNHLAAGRSGGSMAPSVVVDNTTSMRVDGNNVDIDKEMASLAKNSIYYSAVAQQMNKYYGILKSAIKEGK